MLGLAWALSQDQTGGGDAARSDNSGTAAQPPDPDGECDTPPKQCYRGAKGDEPPSFKPRPNDYKIDKKTGFVKPTHGVSVNANSGTLTSKGFVPHEIDQSSIPNTLRIIQRGKDSGHYEIAPRPGVNLTPEEFAEELAKITIR